jgi:DNA-binding transcriptional regulator LsrR (DeoR family)
MTRPTSTDRYSEVIALAEAHYARQGFVKWTDLATELGLSRQRILQLLQRAVCLGLITEDDLDRYRSEAALRRDLEKLKLHLVLTPANHEWLTAAHAAAPHGTTTSDLINAALTQYRTTANV